MLVGIFCSREPQKKHNLRSCASMRGSSGHWQNRFSHRSRCVRPVHALSPTRSPAMSTVCSRPTSLRRSSRSAGGHKLSKWLVLWPTSRIQDRSSVVSAVVPGQVERHQVRAAREQRRQTRRIREQPVQPAYRDRHDVEPPALHRKVRQHLPVRVRARRGAVLRRDHHIPQWGPRRRPEHRRREGQAVQEGQGWRLKEI